MRLAANRREPDICGCIQGLNTDSTDSRTGEGGTQVARSVLRLFNNHPRISPLFYAFVYPPLRRIAVIETFCGHGGLLFELLRFASQGHLAGQCRRLHLIALDVTSCGDVRRSEVA